jgi:huntingtin-interacting protein 1-related protein
VKANKDELEKVKRELRFAQEKAEDLERTKGSEVSAMLAKYNREMADLEEALHVSLQLSELTI